MINFYFFTVGSCIASFLGLVIDRFPESSIIRPRSHCDHCQQTLRPLDLIPILSQVLFRFLIGMLSLKPGLASFFCCAIRAFFLFLIFSFCLVVVFWPSTICAPWSIRFSSGWCSTLFACFSPALPS